MTLTADQFRDLIVGGEAAVGAVLAFIDRVWLRKPLFLALLILTAIAGNLVMIISPFNFADGGYYLQAGIAVYGAVMALGGYAVATIGYWVVAFIRGGRKP